MRWSVATDLYSFLPEIAKNCPERSVDSESFPAYRLVAYCAGPILLHSRPRGEFHNHRVGRLVFGAVT